VTRNAIVHTVLLAACWILPGALTAQDAAAADTTSQPQDKGAAPQDSSGAGKADAGDANAAEKATVAPLVAVIAAVAKDAAELSDDALAEGLVDPLRELRATLSALEADLPKRLARQRDVRAALVAGVASAIGDSNRAEAIVSLTVNRVRERRTVDLHRKLKCWCKNDNWARTLEGCWETCVEPQRKLVRQWLDEGRTDEEVISAMVQAAGTDKVLVRPRSHAPTILVICGAGVAIAFVVFVLALLVRKSAASRPVLDDDSDLDAATEARVDEELRRLED